MGTRKMLSGVPTFLLLLIILPVSNSYAQLGPQPRMVDIYMTGETLTSECRSFLSIMKQGGMGTVQQTFESGYCRGYVYGILDVINYENLSVSPVLGRLCLPPGLNANTATEIVAQYVDTHPEQRTNAGYWLVRVALANAFPCQ